MGYRNQPVIQDLYGVQAGAKASAQVSQAIVQGAQTFASVQQKQREKRDKLKASYTRTFNQLSTAASKRQDVYAANMVEKGASLEMVEAYRANARRVFNGDGSWEEGDDITDTNVGVIRAQAMINENRFSNAAEREQLDKIVATGSSTLDWSLRVGGDYGAEIKQLKTWFENGMSTEDFNLLGFSDGDQMTTLYTASAMADKNIPGVTSSMTLDPKTKSQVWTHTIDINDPKIKDLDLTASDMESISITKKGGKYIMVQEFAPDFNGDILKAIPPSNNWITLGKDIVMKDGKLISDYVIDFGTKMIPVPGRKGFVEPTTMSYLTDTALTTNMDVKLTEAAGRVVGSITEEGGMTRKGQYGYMKSRHGVDLKETHPTWFTTMSQKEKIGIIKGYEEISMLETYADGYTKQKLTPPQIQEILSRKADGDITLQTIPDEGTPEFEIWKNGEHYVNIVKQAVRNSIKDNIDEDLTEWNKKSKIWFNDPNFGKNNDKYYVPGVPSVGIEGKEGYTAAIPPVNEGFANIIYGKPGREGIGSRSIIQTGEDTWMAIQVVNYGNNNFGYKPVGKSVKKHDPTLKQWLGIN